MSIPEPEVQAILALCHHNDSHFHPDCEACLFRQAAAIEHMQGVIAECIESLNEGEAKC